MKITAVNICILVLCIIICTEAAPPKKSVKFIPTWTNLVAPVFPVDLDGYGSNVYTTTLGGQILRFPKADNVQQSQVTTWLDLSAPANTKVPFFTNGELGGDEGLLSFEFHPDTINSAVKKFYTFSSTSPTTVQVTAWNTTSTGAVDYNSAVPLIRIAKPLARALPSGIVEAYLGGDLKFRKDSVDDDDDDDDSNGVNNLYISVGFGNDETTAQNVNSPLGKILRITPNSRNNGYTVPTSNPFFNKQGLDEIFALGFRNPRKFTVTKEPADIFVGDVGNFFDEVNRLEDGGQNFGYSLFDGCRPTGDDDDTYTFPIHSYTDAVNPHTITLGPYYPSNGAIKSIRERLLFADLYSGKLFSIQTTNTAECSVTPDDDDDDGTTPTLVTSTEGLAISAFALVDNVVYATNVFAAFDPSGSTPGFYKLVEA